MTNHVHILLTENLHPGPLSDDEFLRRVGALYQGKALRGIEQKLGRFREQGSEAGAAEYRPGSITNLCCDFGSHAVTSTLLARRPRSMSIQLRPPHFAKPL